MIWSRLARLFLVAGILLLAGAIFYQNDALLLTGALLAGWMILESSLFTFTLIAIRGRGLRIQRRFPELGADGVTWTGVELLCQVRARFDGLSCLGSILIEDMLPAGMRCREPRWSGAMRPGRRVGWSYKLKILEAGIYTLDGLSCTVASPTGLFHAFLFFEDPKELKVYPNVFGIGAARASKKALNRLLQLGAHRYPNRGGAGELLEIREYRPGDPLRRIAWKISARRDQIFVRELEREVPIRSMVFVDGGPSARLGERGARPIDMMIRVSGRALRGSMEGRDPVGLCLFDARNTRWIPPGLGRHHLFKGLRALAEFSTSTPYGYLANLQGLIPQVETHVLRRYPELFTPERNPEPRLLIPALSKRERRNRLVVRHLVAIVTLVLGRDPAGASIIADDKKALGELMTQYALRSGLHFALEPGLTSEQLKDEARERAKMLEKLILRAVARAEDHELYVIAFDDSAGDPGPVLPAIRHARSRDHRVLLLLPDLVGEGQSEGRELEQLLDRRDPSEKVDALLKDVYEYELAQRRRSFLAQLRRLGVPYVRLDPARNADSIARQVQALKHQGALR